MKKTFLLLATIICACLLSAQTKITGKVSDETGLPLIGVSVMEKESTGSASNGTVTDLDGNYTLNAKKGQGELVFSYIGMNSMVKPFKGNSVINIKLLSASINMNEVVVVGYGSQKKVSVVGAISTVNTKELVQSPAANLSNALAGRLTGLTTVQNTGQPGKDDASLYIRGRSTWVNSSPLFIVDGVERDNFTQVDANEVETISILKDASATAVYGVRGANGVLIITTKRGMEQKAVVSLSAQYGFQSPTRLPNYLRSYETAKLRNESYINDGYSTDQLPFQASALEAFRTGSDPYHYPDVDWYDEVLRKTTPQSQYNVNVRGGTKSVRYFVSSGYFYQNGLFKTEKQDDYNTNFKYNRLNFRSNLDIDVSKALTLSVSISARMEDTNEPGNSYYAGAEKQNAFESLTRTPPYETPLLQANGKPGIGSMATNPWLKINGFGYTKNKKDVVESNVNLRYNLDKVTKGLTAKALFSYDSYYSQQWRYTKNTAAYRLDSAPGEPDLYTIVGEDTELKYAGGGASSYQKVYLEASLNYDRKFGKNNITGLVLGNVEDKQFGGTYIPYRYMGLVARATYDYDQRYLAEVNMGYNGSENFARGKRFGFFPSLSAGWVVSNEEFFKESTSFINFLKLRASYGMVGNDRIGGSRFMYSEEYSTRDSWVAPTVPYFGYSGAAVNIVTLSRIANPGLTWEKSNKYNAGIETNFWDDRISVTLDGFLEYRRDILMDRKSLPTYLGVTPPAGNLGRTKNSGFELETKFNEKIGSDFKYWLKANFSLAKNKITFKDEPLNKIEWQKEEGQSIGQFYGYQVIRFFDIDDFEADGTLKSTFAKQLVGEAPKPGDFQYADINNDMVVDDRDKVAIGKSDIPEASYGFSYGFSYKDFDFSMMWQGAFGVSLNVTNESMYEFCERGKVLDIHRGRWAYYTDPFTGEQVDTRATATYPRLHSQSSSPNWTTNSFFLYDSKYLKLRNVEIGYTLPKRALSFLGIEKMRLYATGQNLLTLTKVKQVDPEGPGYGGNKERGWNYPQLAIMNFGLNITF